MKVSNWQEMQAAIIQELQAKADELRERATVIDQLADKLITGGWWTIIPKLNREEANEYNDLDDLDRLQEAGNNWPDVTGKSGAGYWGGYCDTSTAQ